MIGLGNRAIPARRLLRVVPPVLSARATCSSRVARYGLPRSPTLTGTGPGRGISSWTPHPPGERNPGRTAAAPPVGYAVVPTSGCCSAVDPSITVGAALLAVMAILRGFAFSAMGIRRVSTPAS